MPVIKSRGGVQIRAPWRWDKSSLLLCERGHGGEVWRETAASEVHLLFRHRGGYLILSEGYRKEHGNEVTRD